MSKLIDLTGMKFGRLTVIDRAKDGTRANGSTYVRWICRCDCGKELIVCGGNLRRGYSKSCGCYQKEQLAKIETKHGQAIHGKRSRLYICWRGIKLRCNNPNNPSYKDYGGRGISMCNEWMNDFQAFNNWAISHGYADNLTIDRIDVNGNYEPSNCHWVTMKEQQNNRRNNHLITHNGETHTMMQWSEITGIAFHTIKSRLKSGWSVERALTEPPHTKSKKVS